MSAPTLTASSLTPYDAVLLLSFGGPEQPEDVLPFMRNVTRGKGIPEERLVEVSQHYALFGGRSPINDQNRALLAALRAELDARGVDTPLAWGNRNWEPYTDGALADLRERGAQRVLALVTSAYGSYSGCRQYREHVAAALAGVAGEAETPADPEAAAGVRVDKLRHYFNHPGFVRANADAVVEAFTDLAARTGRPVADVVADAPLLFVTHSIPLAMEAGSAAARPGYVAQHEDACTQVAALVAADLGVAPSWTLAFCSRSGPPSQPWLEPDVNDVLAERAQDGVTAVVMSPIGFVSDHMEVAYDLDTEAMATAADLGITAVRAGSASTRAPFVAGLVDLLLERAAAERGEEPARTTVGGLGAWPDRCAVGCCFQRAGVDTGTPAVAGQDSRTHDETTSEGAAAR
ncbi:putative ferrochelatase [Cellulomonas hominis]|uniref:Coproporphyrin III ferrochelatase n=1 Tax=Cellulomonas hominis TaxID=156981 RepID=A0A511FE64_9CELL|nr:ferrochelatase [Cellulomonas hominis]MBB5473958.1 ferrochelatase [Cellulomonas hominis]NKY07441.1 ferrochelatase [Cellulomonas hominis]GEL47521.1 putative ferrochelatase [Cellulomonas hominis]